MKWLDALLGIPAAKPAKKYNGFALCIGLNAVDPDFYEGWDGKLNACENDANAMKHYLESRGFHTSVLITKDATRDRVLMKLRELAALAMPGDLVVVTNSSHGGQVPDYDSTEADGMDETICMYDGQIIDDELENAWARFSAGVRVLFVSDSCHSGTVARMRFSEHDRMLNTTDGSKALPQLTQSEIIIKQDSRLQVIKADAARQRSEITCNVLAMGACQDNQTAMDGRVNGAFTQALLDSLRRYAGDSYGRIVTHCRRALPPSQTPSYTYAGPELASFESDPAFTI